MLSVDEDLLCFSEDLLVFVCKYYHGEDERIRLFEDVVDCLSFPGIVENDGVAELLLGVRDLELFPFVTGVNFDQFCDDLREKLGEVKRR